MANSTDTHAQCWSGCAELAQVKRCIRNGHAVLILLRGVPGSGKTFLARELVQGTDGAIFSTDSYFEESGEYKFDGERLSEFHKRNLFDAKNAMMNGVKPVIVDNTNVYSAHMRPYIIQAVKFFYEVYFVEPQTEWKYKAGECARKNTHLITEAKISRLLDEFEKVNLEHVIKPVKLKLSPPLDDGEDDGFANEAPVSSKVIGGGSWLISHTNFGNARGLPQSSLRSALSVPAASSQKQVAPRYAFPFPPQVPATPPFTPQSIFSSSREVVPMIPDAATPGPSSSPKTSVPMPSTAVNSKGIFSLLPVLQKTEVSIGIQTGEVIRLLFDCDQMPTECLAQIYTEPENVVVRRIRRGDENSYKDASAQTSCDGAASEADLLLTLFPDEGAADLVHFLETVGLHRTVGIFKEIGARMDIFGVPDENVGEYEPLSVTEPVTDGLEEHFENVAMAYQVPDGLGACEVVPDDLALNTMPDSVPRGLDLFSVVSEAFGGTAQGPSGGGEDLRPENTLPPSSSKQRSCPDPIADDNFRMELSSDMILKLSELFGSDDDVKFCKSYVDLPIWRWRQIYEAWQGLPITDPGSDGFLCENFDLAFPSTLGDSPTFGGEMKTDAEQLMAIDEEIAKTLQEEEFTAPSISAAPVRRGLDFAAQLGLRQLQEEFHEVDKERIAECLKDNGYSVSATRATLELYMAPRDRKVVLGNLDPPFKFGNTEKSKSPELPRYRTADGFTVSRPDLSSAHERALELQNEIDQLLLKRSEECHKGAKAKDIAVKQYHFSEGREFGIRARQLWARKNELLKHANSAPTFIDVHYMDVGSAVKLLREKLARLDRPPNQRNGRSGKKIVIVTGCGRSNNGIVRLKPAIVQWLSQCGYSFHYSPNPGEVYAEAK